VEKSSSAEILFPQREQNRASRRAKADESLIGATIPVSQPPVNRSTAAVRYVGNEIKLLPRASLALAIDPTTFLPSLQQVRWPPSLIADNPGQAMPRLLIRKLSYAGCHTWPFCEK
jgi:hypothetical protein